MMLMLKRSKRPKKILALNGMQDAITVGANDLLAGIKTKVELITANILAEIIVPLIPTLMNA